MKAKQVQVQLFQQLPRYTDLFSTTIDIDLLSLTGTTVTAITPTPHNLTVGRTVNITGAIIKNPIISLTQTNNIATAITEFDHDLTEGFNFEVDIEGAAQTEYNNLHELLSVPNRRTFTFRITGNPTSPASGTIFLNEFERSVNPYNGLKVITEVPAPTVFKYEISGNVYSPPTGDITAKSDIRVGGAMTYEKASEWYSKQGRNQFWIYVVLNDRSASKDRHTEDDATATTPVGTRYRERVIAPITCFVFAPLPDDTSVRGVSGREMRDTMEDVFFALCKSLLRKKFSTLFTELAWSELMFVNHGFYDYNQATYVHQYTFESTFDITWDDTIEPDENVAFRDIELDFQKLTDDDIIATAAINLDDVPL